MHFQPSNLLIKRNKVMAHYLCCLFYNKCLGMLQGVMLESENKLYSSSFLWYWRSASTSPNPITGPKQSTCEHWHLQLSNLDHLLLHYFKFIFYSHGKNFHNPTLREVWGRHSHSRKWEFRVLRDSRKFRRRLQGSKHLAWRYYLYRWKGLEV
jgi:hypothetical protein